MTAPTTTTSSDRIASAPTERLRIPSPPETPTRPPSPPATAPVGLAPDDGEMPDGVSPDAVAKARRQETRTALAFLAPNILGFLSFTLIPLIFSLIFAFTNWDLKLHNQFKEDLPRFIGLQNFREMLGQADFYRYLGNTLFFMMGIPFGIAGSLIAALLLSKDLSGGGGRNRWWLIGGASLFAGVLLAISIAVWAYARGSEGGAGMTPMLILIAAVVGAISVGGAIGGVTVYRTLFYLPHFTAGVATYLLWKKMFNPNSGPLTAVLSGPLESLTNLVRSVPAPLVESLGLLLMIVTAAVLWLTLSKLSKMVRDGDLGWGAMVVPVGLVLLPAILGANWLGTFTRDGIQGSSLAAAGGVLLWVAALALLWNGLRLFRGQEVSSKPSEGFGSALMFAAGVMVLQFILIGLVVATVRLPVLAASEEGLAPPNWLSDARWVKPSLMLVSFWGAIGSNTMLLYIAALTNVPAELYEAADIDGARPFQRFWNVTWPQLAPTTFFVVVMAMIGGLQGGFEMVRTMTEGGPGGSSTPLAYFVFTEGFEVGRLGFASAVAWSLFVMIFIITLFNWTFGNRYVND